MSDKVVAIRKPDRQGLQDTVDELRRAMQSGDASEQRRAASMLPVAEFCLWAYDAHDAHIAAKAPADGGGNANQ